jgi:hypothetical protein
MAGYHSFEPLFVSVSVAAEDHGQSTKGTVFRRNTRVLYQRKSGTNHLQTTLRWLRAGSATRTGLVRFRPSATLSVSILSRQTSRLRFCLLCSKESRTVRLKNTKPIPIRWRLTGIGHDGIGQEFSTKTDTGIVEPLSTYELQLNYYASRPRSPASQKNKLILKLEVSSSLVGPSDYGCSRRLNRYPTRKVCRVPSKR